MDTMFVITKYNESDGEVPIGYYSNNLDAQKYCLKKNSPRLGSSLYCVTEVECLDGSEDLSEIKPKCVYFARFTKETNNYEVPNVSDYVKFYLGEHFESDRIHAIGYGLCDHPEIHIEVNADAEEPYETVYERINSYMNTLREHCKNDFDNRALVESGCDKLNKELSREETLRKNKAKEKELEEQQRKIEERELAELKRLKEKYGEV